jgi:hypothetical protein
MHTARYGSQAHVGRELQLPLTCSGSVAATQRPCMRWRQHDRDGAHEDEGTVTLQCKCSAAQRKCKRKCKCKCECECKCKCKCKCRCRSVHLVLDAVTCGTEKMDQTPCRLRSKAARRGGGLAALGVLCVDSLRCHALLLIKGSSIDQHQHVFSRAGP